MFIHVQKTKYIVCTIYQVWSNVIVAVTGVDDGPLESGLFFLGFGLGLPELMSLSECVSRSVSE